MPFSYIRERGYGYVQAVHCKKQKQLHLKKVVLSVPKVDRINEVLDSLRNSVEDDRIKPFLRLIEQGLSYSDVLLMMKWYKVLPR